jgi:carboxymethylenebutenolidase
VTFTSLLLIALSGLQPASAQPSPSFDEAIAAHGKPQLAPGQAPGELISFQAGQLTLHGYLYKPQGHGPFPAVLWNHGSEKLPGWQPELAAFYNSKGYVFFIPHRHGHGKSPGDYIVDLERSFRERNKDRAASNRESVRLHEVYDSDVVAAVEWLKSQPFVDKSRIVMSGVSYGGIQTLLSAEKGLGIRAFVSFAPAAMSWAGNVELRKRLLQAVKNARAPLFLLQAANDYNLGPSKILGPEIKRRGPPNRAKVYPSFGTTNMQGHGAFACWDLGTRIWGPDVMAFIDEVLAQGKQQCAVRRPALGVTATCLIMSLSHEAS